MLNAGVPISRALEAAHKRGKYGRIFKQIQAEIAAGHSLSDTVNARKRHFDKLDRALIHVGEQTGQTAEMFEMLSEWYAFRQRLARVVRSGMMLPVVQIHLLAIIAPVISFALNGFDGSVWVKGFFSILATFYIPAAIILGIIFLTPKTGPLRWILDIFVMGIPLLGKAIRQLELSRYSKVFSITYKAGVPITEATQMATDSVNNLVMHKMLYGALEKVKVGDEMTSGFSKNLPGEFISVWEVGEETGDLDESAWRLGNMHAENAEMRFTAIAQWVPRIIYVIVACYMVYHIFQGYSKIYGGMGL
jgi:MSHA biogenesis protein MshG